MQEWEGPRLGERPPLDEGQEQMPAQGREVGGWVSSGDRSSPGTGDCAQGPGNIGRRVHPLVMKIGGVEGGGKCPEQKSP